MEAESRSNRLIMMRKSKIKKMSKKTAITRRDKMDSWICDVCGKEVNDLYFTKSGKEICEPCKVKRGKNERKTKNHKS